MSMMLFGGPGFMVSDLSIATGGVIGAPIAFQYGLPASRAGQTVENHLARIYGVDLKMENDFFVNGNKDIRLTTGLGAFKANLARALVTPKGAIWWSKDYGIGLVEFLNQKASAANLHEMQNRIHLNLRAEPAVEEVSRNQVIAGVANPGVIEVYVNVIVSGQALHIALEIRSAN